ncbi:hypothetical protein GEV33_002316 [Tenebrio molitor]|uniref:Peptidase C1A papain C-terminal domain-containing protein n=1 Tax=Tenebrio molitor TaxID=7067 RepID=A0A8J6LG47_TENMO|nr:hypothetical protein GEV33_002316 [Tenebrio molitor]
MFQNLVVIIIITIEPLNLAVPPNNVLSKEFIEKINKMNSSWRAGKTISEDTLNQILEGLSGNQVEPVELEVMSTLNHRTKFFQDIPDSFDARENWPQCKDIIGTITAQGLCASCWAHASARVISDRICIESKGTTKVNISVEDLVTCCKTCTSTNGCQSGKIDKAIEYWVSKGVVTGGLQDTNIGCKPITSINTRTAPPCKQTCTNSNYQIHYNNDKHFGKSSYRVDSKDIVQMQIEIMMHGPVVSNFEVMGDFITYQEGVYRHLQGNFIGVHTFRILGWGVENGTNYWLAANSWGPTFGKLGGFVKVLRGVNHLNIESTVLTGRTMVQCFQEPPMDAEEIQVSC